jgi:hypothetical protein
MSNASGGGALAAAGEVGDGTGALVENASMGSVGGLTDHGDVDGTAGIGGTAGIAGIVGTWRALAVSMGVAGGGGGGGGTAGIDDDDGDVEAFHDGGGGGTGGMNDVEGRRGCGASGGGGGTAGIARDDVAAEGSADGAAGGAGGDTGPSDVDGGTLKNGCVCSSGSSSASAPAVVVPAIGIADDGAGAAGETSLWVGGGAGRKGSVRSSRSCENVVADGVLAASGSLGRGSGGAVRNGLVCSSRSSLSSRRWEDDEPVAAGASPGGGTPAAGRNDCVWSAWSSTRVSPAWAGGDVGGARWLAGEEGPGASVIWSRSDAVTGFVAAALVDQGAPSSALSAGTQRDVISGSA